jgi:hypothetical protein
MARAGYDGAQRRRSLGGAPQQDAQILDNRFKAGGEPPRGSLSTCSPSGITLSQAVESMARRVLHR